MIEAASTSGRSLQSWSRSFTASKYTDSVMTVANAPLGGGGGGSTPRGGGGGGGVPTTGGDGVGGGGGGVGGDGTVTFCST